MVNDLLLEENELKNGNLKVCLGVNQSLKKHGWLSVSIIGNPDIKENAAVLTKIKDESCSVIFASHILEHLNYSGSGDERTEQTVSVLQGWHK